MTPPTEPPAPAPSPPDGTTNLPLPDDESSPERENRFHTYITHRVPWFVHILWLGFWVLAIWYVLTYQFPIIPREIKSPP